MAPESLPKWSVLGTELGPYFQCPPCSTVSQGSISPSQHPGQWSSALQSSKKEQNPGQRGEVLRDHTAPSSAQNLRLTSRLTLVSVLLMNTNSCGWLLSLNPYFRISGITEPEKFGEFPLKFNVCVQQDVMEVHHLTFLLGFVDKILNLFLLWQVFKKTHTWSECVPNIVFFFSSDENWKQRLIKKIVIRVPAKEATASTALKLVNKRLLSKGCLNSNGF